jgi:hypothetical protein
MKIIRRAAAIGACVFIFGCAGVDLDKGTRLAEVRLAEVSTRTVQVRLPEGNADIVLAVRDGKCTPVNPATSVDVAISGPGVSDKWVMKAADLSWAFAEGSCDAYGYIYDTATRLSKKIALADGDYRVVVNVHPGAPDPRTAAIWAIYGGRAPTTRMFPGAAHR